MSTIAPPPAAPSTVPGGPGAPGDAGGSGGPRASARVVAILAIVLGVVLVAGALVTGVFSAVRAASQRTETLTTDATGIRSLDIDVAGADLTVAYGGDEVRLTVTGNASDWRLRRDGDGLTVTTERGWWGSWARFGESDVAVLTLPQSLERSGLDADLSLAAGTLQANGAFSALDLDLSAGSIDVSGSARSLEADVSAGRLVFDLADVGEAELQLSAGAANGELSGHAPREVAIDVSAGRLDLTLPDEAYAVTPDVSAGEFTNRLSVGPTAGNSVSVNVSAGYVALRS